MGLPGAILGLLAAAAVLLPRGGCAGSPSHSLRYYYLEMSVPSQGLTQFFVRRYLDDQPIAHYDNISRKMKSLVPRMEEKEKGEEKEEAFLGPEWVFRIELQNLSRHNHPSEGLLTWQAILGCDDGNKGGVFHYGYNGSDFISFENETWVVAQPQAEKVKDQWKDDPVWSQRNKDYLEKTCTEWLRKYVSDRKEYTEPPVGKVTHKEVNDNLEVLICQAFGFYPKEIQATWMRDGEVWKDKTLPRNVAPNSDVTYYLQLSIEIHPKERGRFQCHLEHEGLQEPLDLALKEETAAGWQIPVGIGAAVTAIAVILILIRWCWRRRTIVCQKTKSSLDDFPLEVLPSSPPSGREEHERLLESSPQSTITLDNRAFYAEWSPQRALEDSASTLHRRQGKQPPRRRSKSWAGASEVPWTKRKQQSQSESGARVAEAEHSITTYYETRKSE